MLTQFLSSFCLVVVSNTLYTHSLLLEPKHCYILRVSTGSENLNQNSCCGCQASNEGSTCAAAADAAATATATAAAADATTAPGKLLLHLANSSHLLPW